MFEDKTVMIIGGSGQLGIKLCQILLHRHPGLKRIIIYSRNREKQKEAARLLQKHPKLKFYVGNITQPNRLARAMAGANYVINAGEYEAAEPDTEELLRLYLKGTGNIIQAALKHNVAKVLTISSPDACNPISMRGLAKLCGEKLCLAANLESRRGNKQTIFTVMRYGKAINGLDGIVSTLRRSQETGCLTISEAGATKYWFTLDKGVLWVLKSLAIMQGGETIVPHTPSVRLMDIAKAICPDCQVRLRGLDSGEKLHELLISPEEGVRTLELADYYLIQPEYPCPDRKESLLSGGAREVAEGFSYSSANNFYSLSAEELQIYLHRRR